MDSSKVREALAYAVFRAAGVPAPRTAFAEVVLNVPGRRTGDYLGLYTVVEQVDEQFLAAPFQDGGGLLLKPEGVRGLPYLGDDAAKYEKAYVAKRGASPEAWARLIELTRLIYEADEEEFRSEIGKYFDIYGFVPFLAANAMLSSLDSFVGLGHNYYLYLSPVTQKFSFIPWDLDLAFGGFSMYGSPEQTADLSVAHPHLGENKLIDRLLAMPEVKAAYLDEMRRLVAEVFTTEKLGADLAAVEALAKEPVAKELAAAHKRGDSTNPALFGNMTVTLPIDVFLAKRAESVAAQLAGEREGYTPRATWFGFGAPPPGEGK
jgi:spore coat protein CotH